MSIYVADGTTIGRGDGASPEVFTTIPQVTRIGTVGGSRNLIDITNLSSTAREYRKAIKDGQEIQIVGQYDPGNAVHTGLEADRDAEDPRNYRVTLPNSPATTFTFAAVCTAMSVTNIEIDNVLQFEATLKPTGDITKA